MEYNLKEINQNQSLDIIEENILENIDTLNKLTKKIKEIEESNAKEQNEFISSKENRIKENTKKEKNIIENDDENSLIEEINYYYLQIKDLDINKENYLEKLIQELPSKRNGNYYDIILGINTFLMKEINEIKNFLETEKDIITKEELRDFKQDIIEIQTKINSIIKLSNSNDLEIENSKEEVHNNIVFLETESGNIYAKNDLFSNYVPPEYYEGFLELIRSIEDGTFKNVKYLTSGNNKTAGISEVKGFKKRVIFDRVGYNTYAILGIFIKKSDKDKSYLEPLKNRIAIYRRNRDYIVRQIQNEDDYLDEQRKVLDDIYQLLGTNVKRGR